MNQLAGQTVFIMFIAFHQTAQGGTRDNALIAIEGIFVFLIGDEGIDFSAGMLDQARKKAALKGFKNIEFIEMDMHALTLEPARFDAAVCAFGIFFAEDMDVQLARIAETVRPERPSSRISIALSMISLMKRSPSAQIQSFHLNQISGSSPVTTINAKAYG